MKISTLKSLALGLAAVALSLSVASCELLGLAGPDANNDPPPPAVSPDPFYIFTDATTPHVTLTGGSSSQNGGDLYDLADTGASGIPEGSEAMKIDVGNGAYGGGFARFTARDLSDYTHLHFSINLAGLTPTTTNLLIKLEHGAGGDYMGNTVDIAGLTPDSTSAGWATYTIPLSDYVNVTGTGYHDTQLADLTDVSSIGFWNPTDATPTEAHGVIYVDNVYLTK